MRERVSRRAVMALLPPGLAAALSNTKSVRPLPAVGEFTRFVDPATENFIVRLTAPTSNSVLPAAPNLFVSSKHRILVCSSDRSGKFMPYQVDLRTGVVKRIAETSELDPRSLALVEKKQVVWFRDADALVEAEIQGKKTRTLLTGIEAFSLEPSGAGLYVLRHGKVEQIKGSESIPIADNASPPCLAHPRGKGCFFQRKTGDGASEFWYAPSAESGSQPILLATGAIHDPFWSNQGDSLLFLRDIPSGNVLLTEIREVNLDHASETCVSPTSQFASFAPNEDGSVFVGASRSKAQPNIILLLRHVRREMTLCEHRASHPAQVRPAFAPDSRRVYFQSDHQGKSAIYSVNVELLVEPTESFFQ
ncbi:MAG: PD40 domain-containing protein [Acidobacteriaceae bacterium]|nr:PD40 domain-containing protein [Acidobacteriaceae bacterium]